MTQVYKTPNANSIRATLKHKSFPWSRCPICGHAPSKIQLTSLFLIILWCCFGILLPLTTDEAYYASWSQSLSPGYFDHPPMVAVGAFFYRYFSHPFGARVGMTLFASAVLLLLLKISGLIYGENKEIRLTTLILSGFSFLGMGMGFLLTPDTPFIFFWTLCLYFAVLAVQKSSRYWLLWGISLGLGLLAKYTMVLMPIGLFFYAIFFNRSLFRNRMLYSSVLLALVVFSPNVFWNFQHDFISYRFQLKHGFSLPKSPLSESPIPFKLEGTSRERDLITQATLHEEPGKIRPVKPTNLLARVADGLGRLKDFWGSQFILWGGFSLLLLFHFLKFLRGNYRQGWKPSILKQNGLILSFTVVPFTFFSLISLFSKVEPNWSAMGFIGLAILAAPILAEKSSNLRNIAIAHLILISLIILHTHFHFLPLRSSQDRLSKEILGYSEGSVFAGELQDAQDTPLFAETYQLTAMLRHYLPSHVIYQWQGLTRPSQFTLEKPILKIDVTAKFLLAHNQFPPPLFQGYTLKNLWRIEVCKGKVRIFEIKKIGEKAKCSKLLNRWYLSFFQKIEEGH